jgi:hypothetical protein
MNKSPIAKFQNFMGQIESRERRRFGIHCSSFSFLEQRNPPAKKKKKKTPMASARPHHLTKCKPECRPNGPL